MKTILERIDGRKPDIATIKAAALVIKSGGVVLYPTETCYGLAADATNGKAVERIYKIKERSAGKPIPVIVSSIAMMKKYGKVTKEVMLLAKEFMPGPLTVVTDKKNLPDNLNPSGVAFRISSHPVAYALARLAGRPITATSANISGRPPIYDGSKALEVFGGKVEMVLDAGTLKKVKPSTYVDARSMETVRDGAIPRERIVNFIQRITKR
jgi:L-threonylcarbamoyladenylate synthase